MRLPGGSLIITQEITPPFKSTTHSTTDFLPRILLRILVLPYAHYILHLPVLRSNHPLYLTYWSTYIRPKNSSILLQPTSPYGCRISLCFCTPAYQTISTFLVTHPLGTGEAGTLRSKSSSRLTMSANRGPACET